MVDHGRRIAVSPYRRIVRATARPLIVIA